MKKCLSICLLMLVCFSLFAHEGYELSISSEDTGVYLPSVFYECFDATKNFSFARSHGAEACHDFLFVYEDNIWSLDGDGYMISETEFASYKFFDHVGNHYLMDDKGFLYKRISKEVSFNPLNKYIIDTVFSILKDYKNATLGDDYFIIDGKKFTLVFNNYFLTGNPELWFESPYGSVGFKHDGMGGKFYDTEYDDSDKYGCSYLTDKVVFEIPLLMYEPIETNLYKVEKKDLRLYRNLQFARHGYKFKSEELQNIFGQFNWYEPVNNNVDELLSLREKDLINTCLRIENSN